MNPNVLIGILFGVAAALVAFWLLSDFIVYVYRAGYERGRKDAADWWTKAAGDVEQMQQEIKDEERWP